MEFISSGRDVLPSISMQYKDNFYVLVPLDSAKEITSSIIEKVLEL